LWRREGRGFNKDNLLLGERGKKSQGTRSTRDRVVKCEKQRIGNTSEKTLGEEKGGREGIRRDHQVLRPFKIREKRAQKRGYATGGIPGT